MIEIAVTPTAELNASKVAITLNSAQEFGMQFRRIRIWQGDSRWRRSVGSKPLYSGLLNVTGDAWDNWGSDKDDATYIGDLALAQLGLERAPVPAEEAPAEESGE